MSGEKLAVQTVSGLKIIFVNLFAITLYFAHLLLPVGLIDLQAVIGLKAKLHYAIQLAR